MFMCFATAVRMVLAGLPVLLKNFSMPSRLVPLLDGTNPMRWLTFLSPP